MSIERINPKTDSSSDVYKEHIERYLFAKQYVKNKRVLDIACGNGYGSEVLLSGGAKEVCGVDISSLVIDEANKNYVLENLKFKQGSAERIEFPDNYFDVVVSFETIEHLNNRENFLREVKRVLRPSGIFIVSTPNRILTSCYLFYKHPFNEFHKVEYKKKEFLPILNKYFEVIDLLGQRFVTSILTPYLVRKPIEKVLKIFNPKIERKIYYECDGPEVKKMRLFFQPNYFVAIAKNKK